MAACHPFVPLAGVGSQQSTQKRVRLREERVPGCLGSNLSFALKPNPGVPEDHRPHHTAMLACAVRSFPWGSLFAPNPSQHPTREYPPTPTPTPMAANSCDSQRESFPRKPKKKKFPSIRGNFNHKASGSRGALTAPRTQLGAASIVNTILRGRDINRTYVQGRGEGDECFPKVQIKVINNILLSLLFSHRPLQLARGTRKRAKQKLARAFSSGVNPALPWTWPCGLMWGPALPVLSPGRAGHT